MMELITIDTNIIIKALACVESVRNLFEGQLCYISFMVDIELRSANWMTRNNLSLVEATLKQFIIHPYDYAIQEKAITIRRTHNLKIPDAFIAATSVILKLPLFSGDDCFKNMQGLTFIHVKF